MKAKRKTKQAGKRNAERAETTRGAQTAQGANPSARDTANPSEPVGNGAAVFFDSKSNSSNRIENCTICDNIAKADPSQYSVGPRLNGKGSVIVNSVCLGNKTEAGKEVNLCLQEGAVQSNCYYMAETAKDYKDPKFRGRAKGDYRLRRTSPLRDAGQRLDWMTEGSLDLAGQGRVNGENPDIGCYEYWWYSTGMMLFFK